jgi:hypothetical protein
MTHFGGLKAVDRKFPRSLKIAFGGLEVSFVLVKR